MCAVSSAPGVPGTASVRVRHLMSRLTAGRDGATTRGARSCCLCSATRSTGASTRRTWTLTVWAAGRKQNAPRRKRAWSTGRGAQGIGEFDASSRSCALPGRAFTMNVPISPLAGPRRIMGMVCEPRVVRRLPAVLGLAAESPPTGPACVLTPLDVAAERPRHRMTQARARVCASRVRLARGSSIRCGI
jgi:hypothetical protein